MKETAKSLGEFLGSVLSTVSGAAYIPAAVVVGGVWLAGVFVNSGDESPVEAVVSAPVPTFGQLAVFVVAVMVVAAILEPVQFWLTRLAEGHIPIPLLGKRLLDNKLARYDRLESDRVSAAIGRQLKSPGRIPLRAGYVEKLDEIVRTSSARLQTWPDRDRVVGTRLGNVIRRYEDAANETLAPCRDTLPGNGEIQDLLPFAYFAIPEATREQHAHFRTQLQCMVSMTFCVPLVTFALAMAVGRVCWVVGVLVGGALVSSACASGARSAGDAYGTILLAIARQYVAGSVDVTAPKVVFRPNEELELINR